MAPLVCDVFPFAVSGNQENSTVESAENVRRFDTRSMITIRAQADDNDADYSCEARHPALMATKRAVVTFNVLCKCLVVVRIAPETNGPLFDAPRSTRTAGNLWLHGRREGSHGPGGQFGVHLPRRQPPGADRLVQE